jgi:hypothetical protein
MSTRLCICEQVCFFSRTALAVLHFNENNSRKQAVSQDGTLAYVIKFPKSKAGQHTVRKVPVKATYGYNCCIYIYIYVYTYVCVFMLII